MSAFDIAAGITKDAFNQLLAQLFADPAAKAKIFAYTVTQQLDPLGTVTLNYVVNTAPSVDLTAPSSDRWAKAVNPSKGPAPSKGLAHSKGPAPAGGPAPSTEPAPAADGFQLLFPDISGSVSVNGGPPMAGEGAMILFGSLVTNGGQPYLQVDAIYMDESSFSTWDRFIVNSLLVPQALRMANSVLKGISIPTIPAIAGLSFQPVVIALLQEQIVAATSLTGSPVPDLTGLPIPEGHPIYILVGGPILNTLLQGLVKGKSFSDDGQTGPDAWHAAYKVSATINDVSAVIPTGQDTIDLTVTPGELDASGEIGGTGVGITKVLMCPIAAAIDAASHPGNWDKIIASFSVSISPSSIDVPITVNLVNTGGGADKTVQEAHLSVGSIDDLHIIAKPTWSGDIIGSTLAAASSALVDVIPKQLDKLIINKIISSSFQDMNVYRLPDLSQQIEGVTVSILGVPGQVSVYEPLNMLIQDLAPSIQ